MLSKDVIWGQHLFGDQLILFETIKNLMQFALQLVRECISEHKIFPMKDVGKRDQNSKAYIFKMNNLVKIFGVFNTWVKKNIVVLS